ncbi:RNA-directed DNA polymerase, eukaryota [Tanacetum coccineum]
MDLSGYEVPRVLVTCRRRQIDDENDDDENGQNWAEYDTKERIPFRRQVFPSYLDGQPITGIDIANMIVDQSFAQLYDDDAVSLCCLGILQLVILGVESRRVVPDWMLRLANDRVAWNKYPWGSYVWPTLYSQLRNANVKRWSPLYVAQPTNEDDAKTYSIFGYTWAFKTWILESYRVTATTFFDRYNRYPRVAAWNKKKGRFLGPMAIRFFEGNMPAARLTPDDNEARSDWWISSKAYFDGLIGEVERVPFDLSRQNMYEIPSDIYREFNEQKIEIERNKEEVDKIKEEMRLFKEKMNDQPVRQENNEPIIADDHYGLSDFSQFHSMQSDVEEVPETRFADEPTNNNGDDNSVRRNKTQSEDPFGFYELLNKRKNVSNNEGESEASPKYPPGFTPNDDGDTHVDGESVGKHGQTRNEVVSDAHESICSGHFKKSVGPRTGGSILQLIDDLVNVGQNMGFDMTGCLAQKAKKDWVKKICVTNKVNFLSLQETKMENIDLWCIKRCWGNLAFDYVYSEAVGQSGGILCVWDPNMFRKINDTVSDYFTMVRGVWVPSGKRLLIISIYAPQELSEKRMLWDYLMGVICNWDGDVVTMGDFNEVRDSSERFGSVFNKQGAEAFNAFIANAGLVEVPLGGCSFTWCHKSASKMSKLDRFLISDNLMCACPSISSVSLDRFLSDHRPILMRETHYDYGPTPFKFYHYWFEIDGFDKFVEDSWNEIHVTDTNDYVKFMKKLRILKEKIKIWSRSYKEHTNCGMRNLKSELVNLDSAIDKGEGIETDVIRRQEVVRLLQEMEKTEAMEVAQKAKIKWAIEGDENSKYYHGVLIKKEQPIQKGIQLDREFTNRITSDQNNDLESEVSKEEIKRAVWDCGIDKAPGPDGFTIGFYHRYWNLIESDVVNVVKWFFLHGKIPNGGNSSFITLIPKVPNANMVKDFRPISLIGSVYKIVAKILANRLVTVLGDIVSDTQSAFVKVVLAI